MAKYEYGLKSAINIVAVKLETKHKGSKSKFYLCVIYSQMTTGCLYCTTLLKIPLGKFSTHSMQQPRERNKKKKKPLFAAYTLYYITVEFPGAERVNDQRVAGIYLFESFEPTTYIPDLLKCNSAR